MVNLVRQILPSLILTCAHRVLSTRPHNRIRFVGNYNSWAEAKRESCGYDAQVILNSTIAAARKVREREAVFERDGIAFRQMQYDLAFSRSLCSAVSQEGRLHVLDFGGSLGSTFFHYKPMLTKLRKLRWAIVEQPSHVEAGTKEFATTELSFHNSIEDACEHMDFDLLLLSSVIQYLPDPLDFLATALELAIPTVIIDRTPFMMNGTTRLTVQHVPEWIYPASYPAWFFSEKELLDKFGKHYQQVATWPALDKHNPEGGRAEYKGFLFELKKIA